MDMVGEQRPSKNAGAGPGYPGKSISSRFRETSHEATFLECLTGLAEAWLSSTKRPRKCKIHGFNYVPSQEDFPTEDSIVVSSIVPVLVIPKDRMWRVVYDGSGNITEDPTPITWISYYIGKVWAISRHAQFGQFNEPYRLSHLEIIELDSLNTLIQRQTTRNRLSEDYLMRFRYKIHQ
jgi:hypothetical protein